MKKIGLAIIIFALNSNISLAQGITTIGLGNIRNVTVTSSSTSNTALNTLKLNGFLPNPNASSRFLSQATLGHNFVDIQSIEQIGIDKWINDQYNLPNSFSIENYLTSLHQSIVDTLNFRGQIPTATLQNVNVGDWNFDMAWFQGSMTSPDVLRWRVAMALSEIFVVSRRSDFGDNPYALASYFDLLLNNSFGNYRTILEKITYHPSMAVYLTFMNNHATDVANGRQVFPDENYAREIMQLFSIGLYQLNIDGSEIKDAQNKSIPTYNNDDIAALSKVFTGLSWGDSRYLGDRSIDNWSYTKRMKFYALDSSAARWNNYNPRIVNGHEFGAKTFLGQTIIERPIVDGEQDIQDALNIIFNHPNVGPFISRRLIQRLITSNPTPGYIARVATIFNNNGSGVRGDLKAVIKAILLDYEARDCCNTKPSTSSGMLREPFVRYMNIMKGLPNTTTLGVYRNVMRSNLYDRLEQIPLASPTVFNFFMPDYSPNGPIKNSNKFAPEFQLLNSQTITSYMNGLQRWLINDDPTEYWELFSNEYYKANQDTKFNLIDDYPLAKNSRLPELLDKYNLLFAHGSITPTNINFIKNAISQMPYSEDANGIPNADEASRRVKIAIYLIMSSPDYLINR